MQFCGSLHVVIVLYQINKSMRLTSIEYVILLFSEETSASSAFTLSTSEPTAVVIQTLYKMYKGDYILSLLYYHVLARRIGGKLAILWLDHFMYLTCVQLV